jgi:DNA-binding MarR family transcriptional regulator
MLWEDVSFVLGSKLCKNILECLDSSEKPLAPLQISKSTDIARSNISTKLGQLTKRGLVKCINPKARKWRFYTITDKGKEVLKNIKKV